MWSLVIIALTTGPVNVVAVDTTDFMARDLCEKAREALRSSKYVKETYCAQVER